MLPDGLALVDGDEAGLAGGFREVQLAGEQASLGSGPLRDPILGGLQLPLPRREGSMTGAGRREGACVVAEALQALVHPPSVD